MKKRIQLVSLTALLSVLEANANSFDHGAQTEESQEIAKSVFGLKSYCMNVFGLNDKSRFKKPKYGKIEKKMLDITKVSVLGELKEEIDAIEEATSINGGYSIFDRSRTSVIEFKSTYKKKVNEVIESIEVYQSKILSTEEEE